jgi:excisionase family DNA binding protein
LTTSPPTRRTTTQREQAAHRLLTVGQAAERLGTTERFPRRLIAERRITFVKLGTHVRIPEAAACDLPELLGRAQPMVSHHLSLLVRAGILDREQRGKWAWFRLPPETLAALCTALGEGVALQS